MSEEEGYRAGLYLFASAMLKDPTPKQLKKLNKLPGGYNGFLLHYAKAEKIDNIEELKLMARNDPKSFMSFMKSRGIEF